MIWDDICTEYLFCPQLIHRDDDLYGFQKLCFLFLLWCLLRIFCFFSCGFGLNSFLGGWQRVQLSLILRLWRWTQSGHFISFECCLLIDWRSISSSSTMHIENQKSSNNATMWRWCDSCFCLLFYLRNWSLIFLFHSLRRRLCDVTLLIFVYWRLWLWWLYVVKS